MRVRPVLALFWTAAVAGCTPAAVQCPPLDEERLTDLVEERLLARIRRDEQLRVAPPVAAAPELPDVGTDLPPEGTVRYRVDAEGFAARGASQPVVTLVQFTDFQCPFCSRVVPTIERLVAAYPNEVRWVVRHNPLPFHQDALPAAEAAMEARAQGGDGAFWRMHAILFDQQRALARADLERYAGQAGLDVAAFRVALDGHVHRAAIQADQQDASRIGARGTPAHFLNGRQLMGAQPYEEFEAVVRQEIALARRMLDEGVARREIYAVHMRDALDAPAPTPGNPPPLPSAPSPPPLPTDTVYHVPVGTSPVRGSRTALVTIVEFGDFQCPFCRRATETLEQLRTRYGRDLRIVFKNNPLPFHQEAMPAAEAALEGYAQRRATGFWSMHDQMFEAGGQALDRASLERYAKNAGLDATRFRRALDQHTHQSAVQADQQLAQELGATGTPSFFINGQKLTGAQPVESFVAVIDRELQKARELQRRERVPRARLYDRIIRDGVRDAAQARTAQPSPPPSTYRLTVPTDAPQLGAADAPIVIQMFADFQDPFSERVRPTIQTVLSEYRNQVQIRFRHYPLGFHQDAFLAAEAAVEIQEQGGHQAFWAFHDLLFQNQRALARADLERYAEQIGQVDMTRFRRALDQHTHRARVQSDLDAVRQAGMQIGTPSFLIDDRLLQGAQPIEAFRREIDAALSARGGTP